MKCGVHQNLVLAKELKLANSFGVVVAGQTSLQLHPFLRIMH